MLTGLFLHLYIRQKTLNYKKHYVILKSIEYIGIRCRSNRMIRLASVKRETGASPVRTRHRNKGAKTNISLGNWEDGQCNDF